MNEELKKQSITESVIKGKKRAFAFLPIEGDTVCCTQLNKLNCAGQFICLNGSKSILHKFTDSTSDKVELLIDAKDPDDVQFYLSLNNNEVVTDETENIFGVINFYIIIEENKHAVVCLSINNSDNNKNTRWISSKDQEYMDFILTTFEILGLMKGDLNEKGIA